MCLALYKPAKAKLNRKEMENAFKNNEDGAGFAYFDPYRKRVEIMRGFFTFEAFWAAFEPIQDENLGAIVHFRMATHGAVDFDNCHPFPLKDGALIHNGVISGMTERTYAFGKPNEIGGMKLADRSDTRVFCEDYLAGMEWSDLEKARKLIEERIGWSKLVTIHHDGTVLIFNERQGHWKDGVWYSNDSYAAVEDYSGFRWTYRSTADANEAKPRLSKKQRKKARKAAAQQALMDALRPDDDHTLSPDEKLMAVIAARHGLLDEDDGVPGEQLYEYECPNCGLELRGEDFQFDVFQCPDCGHIGREDEAMASCSY